MKYLEIASSGQFVLNYNIPNISSTNNNAPPIGGSLNNLFTSQTAD